MFAELKRYREEHGHCNAPYKFPVNPPLGKWVSHQRTRQDSRAGAYRRVAKRVLWFEISAAMIPPCDIRYRAVSRGSFAISFANSLGRLLAPRKRTNSTRVTPSTSDPERTDCRLLKVPAPL